MIKKVDNTGLEEKLALRREGIGRMTRPWWVLDCCQGEAVIWGRLRAEGIKPDEYMGADIKPSRNGRLKLDTTRLMSQPLRHNIIDIDAYGSPWKWYLPLLENITQQTIVFLTCVMAIGPKAKSARNMANVSPELLAVAGIKFALPGRVLGAAVVDYITEAMLAREPLKRGLEILDISEIENDGNARYLSITLCPKKQSSPGRITHTT